MLELVAALEVKSSHPVASALVNHYSGCITDKIANFGASVGLPDVTKFTTVPGYGLKGTVSNHHVVVGNIKMMRQSSVHVSLQAERLFGTWADCGQTVIFCSIDGQVIQYALLQQDHLILCIISFKIYMKKSTKTYFNLTCEFKPLKDYLKTLIYFLQSKIHITC